MSEAAPAMKAHPGRKALIQSLRLSRFELGAYTAVHRDYEQRGCVDGRGDLRPGADCVSRQQGDPTTTEAVGFPSVRFAKL